MKTTLIDRKEVASGTMTFFFAKPEGFNYKAGQFADWSLVNPSETDAEGDTRAFSLASAPHEPHLMIATRMRDTAFKRVLRDLPIGAEIEVSEPMGSFTLHNDAKKSAVFLIGGIGVTPVRSMLHDATERGLPHPLTLFYANRRPEDAAFLEELGELQKKNEHFRLIPTMSQADDRWQGETGRVDEAMIRRHIAAPETAVWYLAGPLPMVKAMRDVLVSMGVDDDLVKTEEFSGY